MRVWTMDAFGCFFVSSIVKERKRKFLQKSILKKKISRPLRSVFISRLWQNEKLTVLSYGLSYLLMVFLYLNCVYSLCS